MALRSTTTFLILASLFFLFMPHTQGLPLVQNDQRALRALINGFRDGPPLLRVPVQPWSLNDVPEICNTINYPQIHCRDINSTHSVVDKIVISGAIPVELLPDIKYFTQIEVLAFYNSLLVGSLIPELGELSSLRILHFSGSDTINRPMDMWKHGSIPSSLGNLFDLESLVLEGLLLNGTIPSSFYQLTKLQHLSLRGNELRGPIPDLSPLRGSLQSIDLSINTFDGDIPAWFSQFSNLSSIYLDRNSFSGPIPDLSASRDALQILSLNDNFLTGSIDPIIASFPRLITLHLQHNQLSGPLPAIWLSRLLETVRVSSNYLDGTLPDGMAALNGSLRVLDIADNRMRGSFASKSWLKSFTRLVELSVGGNQWGPGLIPSWLAEVPALSFLRLHSSNFTGEIPQALGTLSRITTFDLSDNFLNCPSYMLAEREACILHDNYLCSADPSVIYRSNCPKVPQSCRTTPCRFSPVQTLLLDTCDGELRQIPTPTSSGVEFFYDPCFPRLRLQFRLPSGPIWTEISMASIGDCANRMCLDVWNTSSIRWSITSTSIRSANNSYVPEVRYRGTLPNKASFEFPFWYFQNLDLLQLYGSTYKIEPKTLKFGMEIRKWKSRWTYIESYVGTDFLIRMSEPVTVNPDFLNFLNEITNNASVSSFGLQFTRSQAQLNFRIPLSGQTDSMLDLGGGVFSADFFNKSEYITKVLSGTPLESLTLPLRLKAGHSISYDPDFNFLFDNAGTLMSPGLSPQVLSEAAIIPIATGVSVSVVVVAVAASIVAIVVWKRYREDTERKQLQKKLAERNGQSETATTKPPETVDSRTRSQTWKQASRPSQIL